MKLPLFLSLFQLVASQALTYWADFGYPPCTQGCLENIYETQACTLANACFCTSSTTSSTSCLCLTDSCLCETSSWLIAIAQCIGKTCGADNVTIAASVGDSGCSANGYQLAVASTALVSYGLAAVPTGASSPTSSPESPTTNVNAGSTPSPTTTANSNPATTSTASASASAAASGSGDGSQPNPIIAAYVVPSVLAGVTIIAMFITWWWKGKEARAFLRNCCGLCWNCCWNPSSEKADSAAGHSQSPEVHAGNYGNSSLPMQNRGQVYSPPYASPPPPPRY